DGELDVAGERGHLDGKHALGDQLTGARAADAYAEHALGLGIDDEFRHAVGAIERDGAATRRPWEARDFDLAALRFRLVLGEARPRDFRIGEDDGRNGGRLERDLLPFDGLDGDTRFVRRLVRQHGIAGDVADSVDRGIGGLPLRVGLDEPALVDLDLGLVEAADLRIGPPADRHEDAVVALLTRRA